MNGLPRPVWYMAHPVSGDLPGNIARAKRWLRYIHYAWPNAVVICPWLLDLEVLPLADHNPAEREIGLQRCEAAARICDAVVLVGGRISTGMKREAAVAKVVLDWTYLGEEAPLISPRNTFAKEEGH